MARKVFLLSFVITSIFVWSYAGERACLQFCQVSEAPPSVEIFCFHTK